MFGITAKTNTDKIRSLRVRIYELMAIMVTLEASQGLAMAHHEAQKSRFWLGNLLKELGELSPYQPSEVQRLYGNTREIPEEADTSDSLNAKIVVEGDRLMTIDRMRSTIEGMIREAKALHGDMARYPNTWALFHIEEALKGLFLTRNFLGIVLGEIRNETVRTGG
jgi:hypothetical protein